MRHLWRFLSVGLVPVLVLVASGASAQEGGACGQPPALNAQGLMFETEPAEVAGAFVQIRRNEPRYVEMDVKAPMALTISTIAPDTDTTLMLFDTGGATVATDDDSGDGSNARIIALLEPGVYCAQVGTFGGLEEPDRLIPLTVTTAPPPDACIVNAGDPVALGPGGEEIISTGRLEGEVRQALRLGPGTGLKIAARSPVFDTFLTVQDGYGRVIGTDDDGGDDTNSLLELPPVIEETTYCVSLTALNDENGIYALSISPGGGQESAAGQ